MENLNTLLERSQAGDRVAFERLVRSQVDRLCKAAWHAVGDSHAAEDVVQEVFLRVLRRRAPYRARGSAEGWLLRTTVRLAVDHVRASGARDRREKAYAMKGELPTSDKDALVSAEERDALLQAFRRLPALTRTCLWLRFGEDLTVREVANAIKKGRSATSERINRGIDSLRAGLSRGLALSALPTGKLLRALPAPKVRADLPTRILAAADAALCTVSKPGAGQGTTESLASIITGGLAVTTTKVAVSTVLAGGLIASIWGIVSVTSDPEPAPSPQIRTPVSRAESKPSAEPPVVRERTERQEGPSATRRLRLAVLWQGSRQPVGGAMVEWSRAVGSARESQSLRANAEGMAAVDCPAERDAAWIQIHHPAGTERRVRVELPREGGLEIDLPVAYGISGIVRSTESGDVMPDAVVVTGEQRTVSDASGRYVLTQLSDGVHSLTAAADGYARERAQVQITQPGTSEYDFSLDLGIDVRVSVRDEAGHPIEGATVTPSRSRAIYLNEDARITDAEGKVTLENMSRSNPEKVQAKKPGSRTSTKAQPASEPEDTIVELTCVLHVHDPDDRVVVGRVTDQEKNPLAGLTVQWIPQTGTIKAGDKTITDESGSYHLSFKHDFKSCLLAVYGDGSPPALRRGVRTGTPENPAVVDFVLPPGQRLEGQVVDEEGQPVPGVTVAAQPNLKWTTDAYWQVIPGAHRESETDSEGTFRVEDLRGPTVGLRVRGPRGEEWSSVEIEGVPVNEPTQIVLKRRGMIRRRVIDHESGKPISVFRVKAEQGAGYPIGKTQSFTSDDGRFVLTGLNRSAAFQLTVHADGYVVTLLEDVLAMPDAQATEQTISLSRGRLIEGTVLDASTSEPVPRATVVLTYDDSVSDGQLWSPEHIRRAPRSQTHVTDSEGSFLFRESEPGTLFVYVNGYRRTLILPEERSEYVTPQGRLVIALDAGESISGVYYDEDGKPIGETRLALFCLAEEREIDNHPTRQFFGTVRTDQSGGFSWDTLRPGTYLIETIRTFPGGVHTEESRAYRRVELMNGEHKAIELANDLGKIVFTGRLLDRKGVAVQEAWLRLRPAFEWHYVEFGAAISAEHASRFWHPGLRPGKYAVEAVIRTDSGTQTIALASIELTQSMERDLEVAFDEK